MGDLTGEYFARIAFLKAVKWLSKYEKIETGIIGDVVKQQQEKVVYLKKKFEETTFSTSTTTKQKRSKHGFTNKSKT